MKLLPEWCKCKEQSYKNVLSADDNVCRCGVDKHHYHCGNCGKITQVG